MNITPSNSLIQTLGTQPTAATAASTALRPDADRQVNRAAPVETQTSQSVSQGSGAEKAGSARASTVSDSATAADSIDPRSNAPRGSYLNLVI